MVELQLPKLTARVRFPSPARDGNPRSQTWGFVIPGGSGPAGRSRGRRRRTTYDGDGSGRARDRKSTRLNSSHVAISYAVFCLKKKTKQVKHVHEGYKTA